MSEENVKGFYEKVGENKSLQTKLKALDIKADINSAIGELVEMAKTEGFVFTSQELKNVRSQKPVIHQGGEQPMQNPFVAAAECTIEWPSCVETNASCVIAEPTPPPSCSTTNADLLCSFGGREENNM